MQSEWVVPAITGLVGIAGIVFTWLTSKQGREHAAELAREEREHERELAKNEREQRRLEETYLALLRMAERAGLWAQSAWPLMDTTPPQPVPPLPSREEQSSVEAQVSAFGSGETRRLMEEWRSIVRQMTVLDWEIKEERQDAEQGHAVDRRSQSSPRRKLDELRGKERKTREALARQIASELEHR